MTIVLTPQEAMALYLYGSKTVPTNKLDPNLIELASEPKTSVDVNLYMDSGPGRFVTAKDFDYVYKFFNPVTTPVNPRQQYYVDLAPGTYTDVQVRAHFAGSAFIVRYQASLSDGIDDQAERAFVWQTVAFEIEDGAKFVIEPDVLLADGTIQKGLRYVQDFRIVPYSSDNNKENFDFVGGTANLNDFPYDPYKIGSETNSSGDPGVEISFSGTRTTTTLTQSQFSTLSTSSSSAGYSSQFFYAYGGGFDQIAKDLFDSGVTKFIHDGKAIVYGIRGGGEVSAGARINEFHQEAFKKGIVFVGSKDDDNLTGVPKGNSILYGNGGSDILNGGAGNDELHGGGKGQQEDGVKDELCGGAGNDSYYVGAGDVICDSDPKDRVNFGGTWLKGPDKKKESCEDHENGGEEEHPDGVPGKNGERYKLEGGTVTVTMSSGGKFTVKDFNEGDFGWKFDESKEESEKFDHSKCFKDPIALDLNGDGITYNPYWNSNTYIDYNGDGFAERTSWVSEDDGILVVDLNSNGLIDNAAEIFAAGPVFGLEALALLDSNSDGRVDSADVQFSLLKVWLDVDGSGSVDEAEMLTLTERGITSIFTAGAANVTDTVDDGVTVLQSSTATLADGSTIAAAGVNFEFDAHITEYVNGGPIDAAAAALPHLNGYGTVKDLDAAMTEDGVLLQKVANITAFTSADAWKLAAAVEAVILRWHGTEGTAEGTRGTAVDARHLEALERLVGVKFENSNVAGFNQSARNDAGSLLANTFDQYHGKVIARLLAQSELGQTLFPELGYFSQVSLEVATGTSVATVLQRMATFAPAEPMEKLAFWRSMAMVIEAVRDQFTEQGEAFTSAVSAVLATAGISYSFEQLAYARQGLDGGDTIYGHVWDGASVQNNNGTAFDDLIISGKGDDLIIDGGGNNTLVFATGHGNDELELKGGTNWKVKLEGLLATDISVSFDIRLRQAILTIISTGEKITFANALVRNGEVVPVQLVFADGSTLTLGQGAAAPSSVSTAGDDQIIGSALGEVLDGGAGNDAIDGGQGSDTYVLRAGGGQDTIFDSGDAYGTTQSDTVRIDANYADVEVIVPTSGPVIIRLTDGSSFTLQGSNRYNSDIESFVFNDVTLSYESLVTAELFNKKPVSGTAAEDIISGTSEGEVLLGGDGNDTYNFGPGSGIDIVGDSGSYQNIDTVRINANYGDVQILYGSFGPLSFTLSDGSVLTLANTDGFYASDIEVFQFNDTSLTYEEFAKIRYVQGTPLTGTSGNDALVGNATNEVFLGREGTDTYQFGLGAGNDVILEDSDVNATLRVNVDLADCVIVFDLNDNLLFSLSDGSTLKIGNRTTSSSSSTSTSAEAVSTFVFNDQTLSLSAVEQIADIATRTVLGTVGDDTIVVPDSSRFNREDNIIIGGTGNDALDGGDDGDTYVYNSGDGNDIIADTGDASSTNGVQDELDSLVIRGHSENDVTLSRIVDANDDLILTFASTGQTITIRNQLENAPAPGLGEFPEPGVFTASTRFNVPEIERIVFEDTGVVWNVQDVRARLLQDYNSAASETFVGFSNSDDVITAGAGNDTVSGLTGSDTFVYRYGDGNDIINESRSDAGTDILRLTGISRADVNITRSGTNAVVTFASSPLDSIALQGQFGSGGSSNVIERIVFDDGTILTTTDISDIAFRNLATSGDDTITGTAASEKLFLSAGTDTLSGGAGDDVYVLDLGVGGTTTIDENGSTSSTSMDVLKLSGVLPSEVVVTVSGTFDLLFTLPDGTVKIVGQRATSTADVIEKVLFDDGTVWDTADIAAQYITVSGAGATLVATTGDDTLVGTAADETLDGGLGNDSLSGGSGSDLYVFGRGVGNDRITENGNDARFAVDRVDMQGVNSTDVTLSRISAEEIQIRINDTGETLILNQQFQTSSKGVEFITFADGVIWDRGFIANNAYWRGTDLADILVGQSNYQNQFLGGKGNDTLDDGAFADAPVFIFNPGDGVDTLISYSPTTADGIVVIHGVSADEISLEVVNLNGRSGLNDLRIRYSATDSIIVSRQFYNADSDPSTGFGISQIRLDDGTVFDLQDILAAKTIGTSGDDLIEGRIVADTIDGGAGDDLLSGNVGNDTYIWRPGSGNDSIFDSGSIYDTDTLLIEGASANDFIFSRSPGDSSELLMTYVPTGEIITLESQSNGYYGRSIDTIRFADGTVLDAAFLAQNFIIRGTADVDLIVGNSDQDSTIEGLAGDDQISGNATDHTLIWTAGDGNDTFNLVVVEGGGEGEPQVALFSSHTTLQGTAGTNVLQMHDVARADVELTRNSSAPLDLAITVLSTGEVLTFTNFFLPVNGSLSSIEFDDSTVIDVVALTRDLPIMGTVEADWIGDSANADQIEGREGDDYIDAGHGLDVIVWRIGDGNDEINLNGTQADADTLRLADSLQSDVTFARGTGENFGSDALIITHNVTGESIVIRGQFSLVQTPDEWQALGQIVFADGSSVSAATIADGLSTPVNAVFGSSGDDILSGTAASETFVGGQGDDTYLFGRGAAEDAVVDSGGNNDVVSFAADVTIESLNLQRIGNDLLIEVGGDDRLTLNLVGQFDPSGFMTVENLSFANGLTLDAEDMRRLVLTQVQTGGNDVILGFNSDDVIFGRGGNDLINGAGGSDYIDGGAGIDVVSFNGTQDEFTVTQSANDTIVTNNWTGEITTLVNVEEVRFTESTPIVLVENLAPVMSGFERMLQEDNRATILAVDLLATAVDPEGAALQLVSVDSVSGGSVSLDAFGNVVFVPNPEFSGTASFSYTIGDGVFNVTSTATLTINSVNDAPIVVSELERVIVEEDAPISFALPPGTFTDIDTPDLALTATLENGEALPSWLSFDSASQTFNGQPPLNYAGVLRVVVAASDGHSTVSTAFDFIVEEINDIPVATGTLPNVETAEGLAINVVLPAGLFVDPDGDITGYFASLADGGALPTWLSIDPETGSLSGIPPDGSAGTLELTVFASDGRDVASVPLAISIAPSNQAPELRNPMADVEALEDTLVSVALPSETFVDSDGNVLTYTATLSDGTALPTWLVVDSATGAISGTPPLNFNGSFVVKLTASDGALSATDDFVLTIAAVNDAPILSGVISSVSSNEDAFTSFALPQNLFFDVDNAQLALSATLADGSALPSWLSFDATTGGFSGTPPLNFNGNVDVKVIASDGELEASGTFTLAIIPLNDAPVLVNALADVSSFEDEQLNFTLPTDAFSDVDGNNLVLSAKLANGESLPSWLAFNAVAGSFGGTPPVNFYGTITVVVTASDGEMSASDSFDINIKAVNDAPIVTVSLADQTRLEDQSLNISMPNDVFTDVDGDTLTYSATLGDGSGLPTWLTVNATTGALSGTPPLNFNGVLDVKLIASDGSAIASDLFTLKVTAVNDAPVVSMLIPDSSSPEDQAVNFVVPANAFLDVDGNALTLSATLSDGSALPSWLSFNAVTGAFTGTPPLNFGGSIAVKVSASDGELSTFDNFTLEVTPMNDAPVVAQLLADVSTLEDTAISFTLPANAFSDVDNGTLTYTATLSSGAALPTWLSFNSSTRQFNGTPPLNFFGSVAVMVTASDGLLSASDVFALNVTPVNDAPMAVNDGSLTVAFNTTLTVTPASLLANDSDVDGNSLSIVSVQSAVNGTVALHTAGNIIFTPTTGYSGNASFTYTLSDGNGGTSTATVAVSVSSGSNVINGTAGFNFLIGTSADDIINALAGNDIVFAGSGNDTIYAGTGSDIVEAGNGNDFIYGEAGNDILFGNGGNDITYGGDGEDLVFGADGNDIIYGDLGNDNLYGDAGSDILFGGSGTDTLNGGSGNDILSGQGGNDMLIGGSGNDSFVFATGLGKDRVNDFQAGSNLSDVIQLSLGANFDTFAEVMASTTNVGGSAVIAISTTETITLVGVNKTALVENDFLFT